MNAVDVFCGCGGLSLGLQWAGIDVLAGFDNWDKAIAVYRRHFSHPIYSESLGLPVTDDVLSKLRKLNPDMIAGGPPCQDYSHAGKRDEERGRADLTLSFAEIICQIRPKFFLMENVDRIRHSLRLRSLKDKLSQAGYFYSETVLDASLCGVPQKRKRYFLFGALGADVSDFPFICVSHQHSSPMTVRDYLGASLGVEHYYRHPRNYSRRGIFGIDESSPTIRGVNRPIPSGYTGHPNDPVPLTKSIRPLTTIERSYIQTFPAGYPFVGNKSDLEQMIGNAVPVKLAEFVGMCILKCSAVKQLQSDKAV